MPALSSWIARRWRSLPPGRARPTRATPPESTEEEPQSSFVQCCACRQPLDRAPGGFQRGEPCRPDAKPPACLPAWLTGRLREPRLDEPLLLESIECDVDRSS